MNVLFFWLFSIGMLVCAAAVIFNRNAVASALCFTFSICFMAGLFIMLNAFFLAAVQIIVTAGAVMVLFLFIIMLLDVSALEHAPRHWIWTACTGLLALAFLLIVAKTLHTTPTALNMTPPIATSAVKTKTTFVQASQGSRVNGIVSVSVPVTQNDFDQNDDTHKIGRLLFNTQAGTSYVAPFEITSLIILIATVGVIVLCKQDDSPRPSARESISREAPPSGKADRETALRN